MLTVRSCLDPSSWDEVINNLGGHPLQLWAWGEVKTRHGWSVERLLVLDSGVPCGGAQILSRKTPVPGKPILYSPRGPVWEQGRGEEVVQAFASHLKNKRRAVVWTVEPDDVELPADSLFQRGNQILLPETLIVDLSEGMEESFLSGMAKKTRYYVRKAIDNPNITFRRVTTSDELEMLLDVYDATASRAGFALHSRDYYRDIHAFFGDDSIVMAAFWEGEIVAFLWDVCSRRTSFELYGGSTTQGQQIFANYGLKLAMARELLSRGVIRYDLNGLLGDGVSSFKRGFARHVDQLAGTFDLPISLLYRPYVTALPIAKQGFRRIQKAKGKISKIVS